MKNSSKKILSFGSRSFVLTAALIVIIGGVISGTVAWMFIKSDPVHNTFSYGDMEVSLTEQDTELDGDEDKNTNAYSLTPDAVIAKDPLVTVKAGTVDCYVFVEVKESDNFDDYMEYSLFDGWELLAGEDNIYYREVLKSEETQHIQVLADNKITVKAGVTQQQLDALDEEDYPSLEFTAYAVQKADLDAKNAWKVAQDK